MKIKSNDTEREWEGGMQDEMAYWLHQSDRCLSVRMAARVYVYKLQTPKCSEESEEKWAEKWFFEEPAKING